jgi:hypothetical protein
MIYENFPKIVSRLLKFYDLYPIFSGTAKYTDARTAMASPYAFILHICCRRTPLQKGGSNVTDKLNLCSLGRQLRASNCGC